MANKDIKIIQEQADGSLKEVAVTPRPNEVMGYDANRTPVTKAFGNAVPEKYARVYISTRDAASVAITVSYDPTAGATGVAHSINGATPTFNALADTANINLNIPTNGGAVIQVDVWAATSATSGPVGYLDRLDNFVTSSNKGYSVQLAENPYMSYLRLCTDELDLSGFSALKTLDLEESTLVSVDLTPCPILDKLEITNCTSLSVLDVSASAAPLLTQLRLGNTGLTEVDLANPSLTSSCVIVSNPSLVTANFESLPATIGTVSVTNNAALSGVVDLSHATGFASLGVRDNPNVTGVLCGSDLSYQYAGFGSSVANNNLDLAALQAFIASLQPTTTGLIKYGGNPGSAAFETWLASNDDKGYVWVNGA